MTVVLFSRKKQSRLTPAHDPVDIEPHTINNLTPMSAEIWSDEECWKQYCLSLDYSFQVLDLLCCDCDNPHTAANITANKCNQCLFTNDNYGQTATAKMGQIQQITKQFVLVIGQIQIAIMFTLLKYVIIHLLRIKYQKIY